MIMSQLEAETPTPTPVRIMEKGCHSFVMNNYSSACIGIGMGESVESSPFVVGGYSFRIVIYPQGANLDSHRLQRMSVFIKNESAEPALVVYDLLILHQGPNVGQNVNVRLQHGHQAFDDHIFYHQVDYVPPGNQFGEFSFVSHNFVKAYCLLNDCIKITTTIGVVHHHHHHHHHHHPPPPTPSPRPSITITSSSSSSFEECILFQVGDRFYYAQESIITKQCPPLLLYYPQSNRTVLISDLEPDVFKGVLWYLENKHIAIEDARAVANSKHLFGVKMIAAADKLKLKHLKLQCILSKVLHRDVFIGDEAVKNLWMKVSSWLSQKMKAA